jgi:hypothetical protein
MRHTVKALLSLVFLAPFMLGTSEDRYLEYYPVYMERKTLETSVFYTNESRELKNPGKIYTKGTSLFVNERYKGIHVIDNTDPGNPIRKGFIVAPGCIDIAVKDNILYLDNSVDLVAFDLVAKRETKRIVNVLPEPCAPNGRRSYEERPKNYILVEWVKQ